MAANPDKAPKKVKEKRQSPEERLQALRYNRMMYGPTSGEPRPVTRKTNYGASYLSHPKFQSLMTAFKNGTAFQFEISDKGKAFTISTDGSHLHFDGRIVFYCRPLNKYEHHLLLDRSSLLHYQANEALVHLAFAVLKYFPELEAPKLTYVLGEFYLEGERLEAGVAAHGPNLLLGSYKHGPGPGKQRA